MPFARYIALHRLTSIKRYHIARVYRRDMPSETKGRFREFYQCDFDIAGTCAPMVPDSECIKLMTEILDQLPIGGYLIKFNHRKLLDGMLEICGVPASNFRPVCSAIDKLDKEPWSAVRCELIQKGCSEATCDLIGTFVVLKGKPRELHAELVSSGRFAKSEQAVKALEEIGLLVNYLDVFEVPEGRVVFDLSLARGLDYYTGIIYEGVLTDGNGIGSICGGGRYDDLAGMFMQTGRTNQVPAVGFSLGLERLFAMLEHREKERSSGIRGSPTMVLVASLGKDMTAERMRVCNMLWKVGIRTEHMYQNKLDLQKQLGFAEHNGIPFVILFGEDERKNGSVKIKNMAERSEIVVKDADIVSAIQGLIAHHEKSLQQFQW